jgi:hypothetical protein
MLVANRHVSLATSRYYSRLMLHDSLNVRAHVRHYIISFIFELSVCSTLDPAPPRIPTVPGYHQYRMKTASLLVIPPRPIQCP